MGKTYCTDVHPWIPTIGLVFETIQLKYLGKRIVITHSGQTGGCEKIPLYHQYLARSRRTGFIYLLDPTARCGHEFKTFWFDRKAQPEMGREIHCPGLEADLKDRIKLGSQDKSYYPWEVMKDMGIAQSLQFGDYIKVGKMYFQFESMGFNEPYASSAQVDVDYLDALLHQRFLLDKYYLSRKWSGFAGAPIVILLAGGEDTLDHSDGGKCLSMTDIVEGMRLYEFDEGERQRPYKVVPCPSAPWDERQTSDIFHRAINWLMSQENSCANTSVCTKGRKLCSNIISCKRKMYSSD